MSSLFNVIIVGLATFFAFRIHILLGIVFVILAALYIFYLNYSSYMAGRANALYSRGEKEKALDYYKKAVSRKGVKLDIVAGYSMILLRSGNPEEALVQINKVLSLSRLPLEIKQKSKYIRSIINYKLGDIDEAFEEASELYDDGYRVSSMRAALGLIMLEAGKPDDETLKFCEDAYDYNSDERDIVDNYLLALINSKKFTEAKDIADNLIEAEPYFAEGYYHGALVYKALGDSKKAAELLDKFPECKISYMTTVSEKDVEALKASL